MTDGSNVIPLHEPEAPAQHRAAERRILGELLQYTLIESLHNFHEHQHPYPFVRQSRLLPAAAGPNREWPFQHAAFLILLDGMMPRPLKKHFRLRAANLVSWRNLLQVLPEEDIADFRAADCDYDALDFAKLMRRLLPLDFALLMQRDADGRAVPRLSHMHVKVERLTDIALKELGRELGYIDRSLFERGEDYVDTFEAKFFEYFGFAPHASGRKGAAAMTAQLLANHDLPFTVFVASQSDPRLTLLKNRHRVEQYFLIRLADGESQPFADYRVAGTPDNTDVFVFRAGFDRTAAAMPGERLSKEQGLKQPWLELVASHIVDPSQSLPPAEFDWPASPEFS